MPYYGIPRKDPLHIDKLFTAFIEEYGSAFSFPGENHEMTEVDCILEGCVGITSGIHVYTCTAGQIVLHPANTFHTVWTVREHAKILTVSFTGAGDWQGGQFEPSEKEKTLVSLLRDTVNTEFAGHFSPAESKVNYTALQRVCDLTELLCLSLSDCQTRAVPHTMSAHARRFSEAVQFLQEHIADAICTEDVCRHCNISRSTLKALFRVYTGQSPMRYYNDLRLRYAVRLIQEGLPMCEISDRMHFSSPCYFSDFVRRMTGQTPQAFRTQYF